MTRILERSRRRLSPRRGRPSLLAAAVLIPAFSPVGAAPHGEAPGRLVHTYSIVARDPETGALGVAVQSHWFSVGSDVLWAEAGVGAVATQSLVEVSYGPLALELMRAGKTSEEALAGLVAADENSDVRQVAVVDASGRAAAHTGARCIPAAGHVTGDGFSCQANLMLNDTVWPAMASAYETAQGDLAERLMRALEAAQAEGGDLRGRQSAAILIVTGEPTGVPWADRVMDLRVEDSKEPLGELRRLIQIHRAYRHMNAGDKALEDGDTQRALEEYGAATRLYSENPEIEYWQAVTMAGAGLLEESLPIFARVFQRDPNWRILTPRLKSVGFLEVDDAGLKRIMGE